MVCTSTRYTSVRKNGWSIDTFQQVSTFHPLKTRSDWMCWDADNGYRLCVSRNSIVLKLKLMDGNDQGVRHFSSQYTFILWWTNQVQFVSQFPSPLMAINAETRCQDVRPTRSQLFSFRSLCPWKSDNITKFEFWNYDSVYVINISLEPDSITRLTWCTDCEYWFSKVLYANKLSRASTWKWHFI